MSPLSPSSSSCCSTPAVSNSFRAKTCREASSDLTSHSFALSFNLHTCNVVVTYKRQLKKWLKIWCDPTKTIESRVYVLFSDHLLMSRLSLDFVLLSSFCFIGWWWLAIRTCYAAQRTVVVNKESISSNSHKY